MKYFNLSALCLLLLILAQAHAGYVCKYHFKVTKSFTCEKASKTKDEMSKINYKDLVHINPELDCNNLKIGQKVCVTVDFSEKYNDINDDITTYKIKKRDTCKSIAKKFGTKKLYIQNFNQGRLNCDDIKVNQVIELRPKNNYAVDFSHSKEFKFKYTTKI